MLGYSILLKVSLGLLGSSIIAGLFGLGGLVASTSDEENEKEKKPLEGNRVTYPIMAQLVLFGIGIGMMVFVIPT
jgi:multisubunit Na+/H+ antiporter MnhC subunit